MELAIAPDGRVFYVERDGAVQSSPDQRQHASPPRTLHVYTGQEFGLLGIGPRPGLRHQRLGLPLLLAATARPDRPASSRFTLDRRHHRPRQREGRLLDVAAQRDAVLPRRRRPGVRQRRQPLHRHRRQHQPVRLRRLRPDRRARPAARPGTPSAPPATPTTCAARSCGSRPEDDGSVHRPDRQPVRRPGTAQTRPEIYAMGFRNPFRIGLDQQHRHAPRRRLRARRRRRPTRTAAPTAGRVEHRRRSPATTAGPTASATTRRTTTTTSRPARPARSSTAPAPVNNSPNNTGLTNLPPADRRRRCGRATTARTPASPEIGASGAPMAWAPTATTPTSTPTRKWPAYYDGKAIWADWNNSRMFTVQLNADGTDYTDVNRFLPNLPMTRPHALQFGPGRRALHDRVGQRLRRQQRRLRHLPDRLRRRATAPRSPAPPPTDLGPGAADRGTSTAAAPATPTAAR